MTISNLVARMTLTAAGERTRPGISGDPTLGVANLAPDVEGLAGAHLYTVHLKFFATGADATLDVSAGTVSSTTALELGSIQVETATVVGTITTAGDAEVVVTAAGMTGSPKTLAVAVEVDDTASDVAGKIRTALAADEDVVEMFAVSGTGATVILSRSVGPMGERYANDATLNIATDNDTCAGLTTAASSANTVAGVASSGTSIEYGTEGEDFEGMELDGDLAGALVAVIVERVQTSGGGTLLLQDATDGSELTVKSRGDAGHLFLTGTDLLASDDLVMTATGKVEVKLHVLDTSL